MISCHARFTRRTTLPWLFAVGALLIATAASAAPPAPATGPTVRLRRFVLLAGVDDGGPTRTRLRYAASDARAMGRVLQTLGGVAPKDIVFVSTPSRCSTSTNAASKAARLGVDTNTMSLGATPPRGCNTRPMARASLAA